MSMLLSLARTALFSVMLCDTGSGSAASGSKEVPTGRVIFVAVETASDLEGRQEFEAFRRAVLQADRMPKGLIFEYHRIGGSVADLEQAAARLLDGPPVALVLASSTPVAWAFQRQSAKVPIVFRGAGDAVSMCMADSLDRPGRNVTGSSTYIGIGDKLVEAAIDAFPRTAEVVVLIDGLPATQSFYDYCAAAFAPSDAWPPCRVGWMLDADEVDRIYSREPFASAARSRGKAVSFYRVCSREDFAHMVKNIGSPPSRAVVVPIQYQFQLHAQSLTAAFNAARIPVVYGRGLFVEAGGLMAVTVRPEATPLRQASELAVQILRGARPGDLAIRTPSSVDLWINVDAATRTGLRPSIQSLQYADRLLRN